MASASWASSEAIRRTMLGNTRRDTAPELELRRRLHALGLRYRVDRRPLPDLNRRADVVFGPARVAVFLHGCFWHGCPDHYSPPGTNIEYWSAKVESNRARDLDTESRLQAAGWLPVIVWEHEDPQAAADVIAAHVRTRRQ